MPIPQSIVFAGCARNCQSYLPAVLNNIERIRSLFATSAMLVCENDSTDNTRDILADWGRSAPNFTLLNLDGLGQTPWPNLRLEFARNTLLDNIRSWPSLRSHELLLVLDFDDVNANDLDLNQLSGALEWMTAQDDVAAIFPNQVGGNYYDMWALRHKTLCPTDIWEDVADYQRLHQCDDETAFAAVFKTREFSLPTDAAPLEVDSAFGGFGAYRLDYVLRNPNPYLGQKTKVIQDAGTIAIVRWQQCEHVHFHAGLRSLGGKLFIIPALVNTDTTTKGVRPSFFRTLPF